MQIGNNMLIFDYNAFKGGSSVRKRKHKRKLGLEPEPKFGHSVMGRFRYKSKFRSKFTDSPKSVIIRLISFSIC